jgi:putative redox protein
MKALHANAEDHVITARTLFPGRTPTQLTARTHQLVSDMTVSEGGEDLGPGAHELFNSSLAACKSLTAFWYAKKNGIPLEGVDVDVQSDNSKERRGEYLLRVKCSFRGNLSEEQQQRLHEAVAKCPVHRLMTQVKISIETIS